MRSAILLCLLVIAGSAGADGWLCVADSATGFRYDKASGTWKPTVLKTDEKLVVRRPNNQDLAEYLKSKEWVVQVVGEAIPFASCDRDFEDKLLTCGTPRGGFEFSADSLRFIVTSAWRALDSDAELAALNHDPDTPYLEIGRCTAL